MKRFAIGLCFALLLPALLAAQGKTAPGQKLILEFVDGQELTVTTADQKVLKFNAGIFEGDPIPVGATVATGSSTSAELRLKPNGSIFRLAKGTVFTVSALGSAAKDKNAFALAAGKVRAVASKGGNYEMRSQTAVCGVRGTDFSFGVEEGAKALLMVSDGLVQFDKLDEAGAVLGSLPIGAGQAADAFAASFESFAFDMGQYAQEFGEMVFAKLQPSEVPPQALDAEPEAAAEPQKDMTPAQAAETMKPDKEAVESGLAKWIRETLGMELGSVTIDSKTYSKAVIQPNMAFGKVKLGLYLPIIYTSNLFDPSDWYKPAGNNEWSFGRDEFSSGDYLGGAGDFARDLALKIKYFEYGEQLVDPFFIKVGNLDDLTLGHGLIMRNYANDTEFPAVRRVGFNVGYDGGGGGVEAIVNDLAAPEIFGLRGFVRPVEGFKLAFGASVVADIAPAASLPVPDSVGDPMFFGAGVDMDLPLVQSGILSARLFADGAVTVPYLRTDIAGVSSGLKYDLVYDSDTHEVKNWGAAGGVMGNVLFVKYRLEYRYFTGLFKPSFFDATYDRNRAKYAAEYAAYLNDPASYSDLPTVMGIYGEGGFSFMKDKLGFSFGYMMPWAPGQAFSEVDDQDEFNASFYIRKGLIPIFDAAGSITYERRGLAAAIADGNFSLLDENTYFGGEIVIPVPKTPTLDLAISFTTVPVTDGSGNVQWKDKDKGIPEMKPSIGIETRFHL